MFNDIQVVSTPEQFAASLDTPAPRVERAPLQCESCEFVANYSDDWFEHQRTTGHELRDGSVAEKRYYYTTVSVFIRARSEDEAQAIGRLAEDACDRIPGVSSATVEDVTDETEDREP